MTQRDTLFYGLQRDPGGLRHIWIFNTQAELDAWIAADPEVRIMTKEDTPYHGLECDADGTSHILVFDTESARANWIAAAPECRNAITRDHLESIAEDIRATLT